MRTRSFRPAVAVALGASAGFALASAVAVLLFGSGRVESAAHVVNYETMMAEMCGVPVSEVSAMTGCAGVTLADPFAQ